MAEAQQLQAQAEPNRPKVLLFLNDYRKKLSLLKIKSFYASHLCRKNCLQGKLDNNNDSCLSSCDSWLQSYFDMKRNQNLDAQNQLLFGSQTVEDARRDDYEKETAIKRVKINQYVSKLEGFISSKIAAETYK